MTCDKASCICILAQSPVVAIMYEMSMLPREAICISLRLPSDADNLRTERLVPRTVPPPGHKVPLVRESLADYLTFMSTHRTLAS